jgi:hypothetical protein
MPESTRPSVVALGAGFLVGVLWLAMAMASLISAFQGLANGRTDWWLAWFLVGTLLAAAGLCAIGATLWHEFRVKRGAHVP